VVKVCEAVLAVDVKKQRPWFEFPQMNPTQTVVTNDVDEGKSMEKWCQITEHIKILTLLSKT
jgi:hypothetical protein